jgi:CubicO group peptidase (beta-lactamase class C family)
MKKIIPLISCLLFYASFSLAEPAVNHASKSPEKNNPFKSIDSFIFQSMKRNNVPVVSIAIIQDGKITYARAYSINNELLATPQSLFQSASIGKSVSAYGSLLLVNKGKINLDKNVNNYLSSWKIPESIFTKKYQVTLRNILDMTSGLSVPGFAGHSVDDTLPSLKQILNGQPPAENQAVQVTFIPGTKHYYSGGSYEVLEQIIEDITHESFSTYMQKNVLMPLTMQDSQFIAVLPKTIWSQAVPGFLKNGEMIPGKWKIIPALGAGGMWTTPSDLAKFAINVMDSYQGKSRGLISQKLAHEMLTRQKNTDFGLGVVIDGCGKSLNFRKEGHNIGFYDWLIAFPNTQQGAIVMTNSENGTPLIKEVMQKIAKEFKWPEHYPITDESQQIPKSDKC